MTLTRAEVSRLLAGIGRRPRQSLGQNFVADPNTVRRIVRLAELPAGAAVVEVGAGLGSLTLALAEAGHPVLAVEIDADLVGVLQTVVAGRDVTVLQGDATDLDWEEVLGSRPEWHLVANLPYHVATPIVLDVLDRVPRIASMLVMVQREVAERLSAGPGDPAYGFPSVKVAYWAEARIVGRVPASVFVPRPKVESALVRLRRRPVPAVAAPRELMFSLARAGFGQRRKMLRRSLAGLVSPAQLEAAGIRPEARAEELSVQDWGRLAEVVAASGGSGG